MGWEMQTKHKKVLILCQEKWKKKPKLAITIQERQFQAMTEMNSKARKRNHLCGSAIIVFVRGSGVEPSEFSPTYKTSILLHIVIGDSVKKQDSTPLLHRLELLIYRNHQLSLYNPIAILTQTSISNQSRQRKPSCNQDRAYYIIPQKRHQSDNLSFRDNQDKYEEMFLLCEV